MKTSLKTPLLATLGICLSGAAVFSASRVESYRMSKPVRVAIPAAPASQDASSNPLDTASLLSFRPILTSAEADAMAQDYTTAVTDSAGRLSFLRPANGAEGHTLTFRIRPERFLKGNLLLQTNARAEMTLNGKKVATQAKADTAEATHKVPLALNPEETALVQVNILSLSSDPADPTVGVEIEKEDSLARFEAGADVARRVEISTTALGQRLARASVSPDGKYVMTVESSTTDGNNFSYRRSILDCQTLKPVYSTLESVEWMPRGSRLHYTAKSVSGQGYDLYTLDPAHPAPKLLATVAEKDFSFSPDESFVVYNTRVEGKKEKGPMLRIADPDDRLPGNRDRLYLAAQDLGSGTVTQLTYGGPSTYLMDIAPDSKRLIYLSTRHTPSEFPFYESSLIELELATLRTDTLAKAASIYSATYSPDGRRLFISAGPEAFDGIGRNAGEFHYANEYDRQGFLFTLADKKVEAVTRDFSPALAGEPVWNRADGKIYFRVDEGFTSPVYCFDPSKKTFTKLATEIEYSRNFSVGENESRWLATTGTSYRYTGRGTLLDLKSGKSRQLPDPFADNLAGINFGQEESWKFTASDGTEIDGMAIYPPDFDPSRKYPLIVYYYGGTTPSIKALTNPYAPQLFAARDYMVYVINPSGTTGYGQEFSARHVNAWGKRTADDIIEGVKLFCQEHPNVDSTKIGCLGASYGGFMTQYLLTRTDIFAAAVSHAGISNVTSYWGEGYWGYSYNSVAAAESYPWNNPKLFTEQGSLFNADKIHTPLLLLHGTDDTNVPPGESIQLFNALSILGRQVELIEVEGENHIIQNYEKRRIWNATIMAWFARWLQDDPAWWKSLYD